MLRVECESCLCVTRDKERGPRKLEELKESDTALALCIQPIVISHFQPCHMHQHSVHDKAHHESLESERIKSSLVYPLILR